MSGDKILSKDEVDALLDSVDNGELGAGHDPAAPGEVRAYDFSHQDRVVRGRLPTLEMINERFARSLRSALFGLLRRSCEVTSVGIKQERYSDYVHGMAVPTSMNFVSVQPLRGTALVVLESALVFNLVENFFGGGRYQARIEGRDFTPTETRLIHIVLRETFAAMSEAWSSVLELKWEYLSSEINPQFANIVNPTETVLVSRFQIGLDGGAADLHVAFPYSMIEPIRELLDSGMQSDRVEKDERWSRNLREDVLDTEIELGATLIETRIRIGDFLRLRRGDVIPIELPERVTISAEDVPIYRGRFGTSSGNNAVRLVDPLRKSDRATKEPSKETP
jgi:flagellar motor switch protein FliM